MNKYALVLVDVKGLGTRTFSYLIPDDLKNEIKIGQPVLVPFGTQGLINAFVVGFSNYLQEGIKAKSIIEILDKEPLFDINYLKLLEWVSNYYFCDIQTVIQSAVPMKYLKQSKRMVEVIDYDDIFSLSDDEKKVIYSINKPIATSALFKKLKKDKSFKLTYAKFYSLLRKLQNKQIINIETVVEDASQKEKKENFVEFVSFDGATTRQKQILEILKDLGKTSLIKFEKLAKTTRTTIKKLATLGCLNIIEEEQYRNPLDIYKNISKTSKNELSTAQEKVYLGIKNSLKNTDKPILLYGITASGKTEIYFKLMNDVLNEGKNILFLVPEIALASQLTKKIASRFGKDNVAIWHSSISDGERYDVWQKLRKDEIKILAGARSSVFAPLKNIGLIIIDEEHEGSYKQTSPSPRYDARLVAQKLAQLNNAKLVLGSATPDVNSYYKAMATSTLFKLKERYNNAPLAPVTVINMNEEMFGSGKHLIFSRTLKRNIEEELDKKKQIILLINRRGYSTSVQCLACGEVVQCPKCAVPLVYHQSENKFKCHWCNYEQTEVTKCKKCGSDALKRFGMGTQKIEELVIKMFPNANIARVDSDIMTKKTQYIDILDDFTNGKIDILIGTQMIAKGLDNSNVSLVGVLSADAGFSLPDYRSCERGFQLLTQVAGRAGRVQGEGRVYFQTYNPDFYALKSAQEQCYEEFYKTEINAREAFDYPPFSQIIRIILTSENNFRAEKSAQEIALRLNTIVDKQGISERVIVLGPTPCVLERIKNEYRFQILIKNKMEEKGHFFVTSFLRQIQLPPDIKMTVIVDPNDIL
ncbi:primosomal protein N' [bacterium]|nr:primosomal protein N' [bacterium]